MTFQKILILFNFTNRSSCFLVAIFFCLFFHEVFSQTTVFEDTKAHQQTIKIYDNISDRHKVIRDIISEIARAIPKKAEMTSFIMEYNALVQIKKLSQYDYSVFCELKNIQYKGDVLYRGINISHYLIPDYVDFHLLIQQKHTPNRLVLLNSYPEIKMEDNMGYFTILHTKFRDTVADEQYIAKIENINFIWGESAKKRFFDGVDLVHKYYIADKTIEEQISILNGIDVKHIEKLSFNNIVLREVEKEYKRLSEYNFQQELRLWHADPVDYIKRMYELQERITKLRKKINEKIEFLDQLYYEMGLQKIKQNDFDSAKFYFNKAVEYNFVYAPAQIELAYLDYRRGVLDSAAIRLIFVMERTIQSAETANRLEMITQYIVNSIEANARTRIINKNYIDAQYLIEYALKICSISKNKVCYDEMNKLMAQIKHGLYRSILFMVEKAIENKRFEIANTYIKQAIEFQKENAAYIITPAEAQRYYEVLFSAYLREIEQMSRRNQHFKTYESVIWLESYCDSVAWLDCRELTALKTISLRNIYNQKIQEIENEINKKNYALADTRLKLLSDFINSHEEIGIDYKYKNAEKKIQTYNYHKEIATGLTNLNYEFYEPAWQHFMKAYEIQEKYELEKYLKIDSYSQKVAAQIFPEYYSKIIAQSTELSFSSLMEKKNTYDSLLKKISMPQTNEILSIQTLLNDIIFKKMCAQLKFDIQNLILRSENHIFRHQFSIADSVLQSAIRLCLNFTMCEFQIDDIIEQKQKLRVGIEWENQKNVLDSLLSMKKWKEAIKQFYILDNISSSHLLFMWGVERVPLHEIIVSCKNIEFLLIGFEYFYEKKLYNESFLMLENLRKLEYPSEKIKKQQIMLGQKLAVRDKIANPNANFKINILKYTEGEEYFTYFSKFYRRTWRKH